MKEPPLISVRSVISGAQADWSEPTGASRLERKRPACKYEFRAIDVLQAGRLRSSQAGTLAFPVADARRGR